MYNRAIWINLSNKEMVNELWVFDCFVTIISKQKVVKTSYSYKINEIFKFINVGSLNLKMKVTTSYLIIFL